MSFTRFHDDTCRRLKQVQESTDPGLYYLNVPGNGVRPHYLDNNFVRLQKWGGNLSNNPVTIESDLRGLTRTLTRDHIIKNSYENNKVVNEMVKYPRNNTQTDQSRATHPAWTFRDIEQVNLTNTPIEFNNISGIPFQNNISSRLTEKDDYNSKC